MNEIFNNSDFWVAASAILSVAAAIRCINKNSDVDDTKTIGGQND